MPIRYLKIAFCSGVIVLCVIVGAAELKADSSRLVTVWDSQAGEQDLGGPDLSHLVRISSHEKDPPSGKVKHWRGVLLSDWVDRALDQLSPDNKAQVDLVILHGAKGETALVPRSLITEFPVMLATRKDEYSVVIPWTSKPRIKKEELPLESYFVSPLVKIELTSYRHEYGSLFLKRRTDPFAMRGEKIFIQDCMACHGASQAPALKTRELASVDHPKMKGIPALSERDHEALKSYFAAYRVENPPKPVQAVR